MITALFNILYHCTQNSPMALCLIVWAFSSISCKHVSDSGVWWLPTKCLLFGDDCAYVTHVARAELQRDLEMHCLCAVLAASLWPNVASRIVLKSQNNIRMDTLVVDLTSTPCFCKYKVRTEEMTFALLCIALVTLHLFCEVGHLWVGVADSVFKG